MWYIKSVLLITGREAPTSAIRQGEQETPDGVFFVYLSYPLDMVVVVDYNKNEEVK